MMLTDARSRQLTVTEALELRHLPDQGLTYNETLSAEWVLGLIQADMVPEDPNLEVLGPSHAQLDILPLGPVDQRPPIQVRGQLKTILRTPCVRCLEDVDIKVDEPLDLTLLAVSSPSEESPTSSQTTENDAAWTEEDAVELEDLGQSTYSGDSIDLPDILREVLLLAMDAHPTCADEQACDVRTQALLDEANRPYREAVDTPDPRWAALKDVIPSEPEE